MYFKDIKSVASNQDVFLINKSRFYVCLKTRRVTKRDALVLATLWYMHLGNICKISVGLKVLVDFFSE